MTHAARFDDNHVDAFVEHEANHRARQGRLAEYDDAADLGGQCRLLVKNQTVAQDGVRTPARS